MKDFKAYRVISEARLDELIEERRQKVASTEPERIEALYALRRISEKLPRELLRLHWPENREQSQALSSRICRGCLEVWPCLTVNTIASHYRIVVPVDAFREHGVPEGFLSKEEQGQ